MQTMDHTRKHLGTLCRNTRNTPGCIFPCFLCVGVQEISRISILGALMPIWCTCAHPITSLGWKHPVVGHTLNYILSKFEVNPIDGSGDIDDFVHPP